MSQNIVIKYNVDSSQVTASTEQVIKAKQATDQLNQSVQKLGQQGSKNNIQFGNTIEGVRLKVAQLKAQIDLTNQSDTKRLNSLIAQYKQAQAVLTSYTDKLKDSTKENNNNAVSFGNIYAAIKLIIGAQLAKQFISMSIEAASLAGKVEGVERAFNRAFPQAKSLINDLRVATHGTVTDFELMQRTLQATNLGVAVEKLPVLLQFAAARAQQTGESVDYLVDSIVRGIGRKSILVLDNLGLSATRLKEQFNGASLASQSVGDVTKAVAKIAQEELEKMGGYVENAETQVNRLKTSWTNLGIEAAKFFTGNGALIKKFNEYVSQLETLVEAQNKGITVEELYRQRRVESAALLGINILKEQEFTESKEHNLKVTKDVIAEKTHELILLQEEGKTLQSNLEKAKQATNASIFNTAERIKNIEAKQKDVTASKIEQQLLIEQIKILKGLQKEFENGIVTEKEYVETLKVLRENLKDLKDQIEETPTSNLGLMKSLEKQADQVQKKIDKILSDLYFLGKSPPVVTVEVKTITNSSNDLSAGIPLANKGLSNQEKTDLLNSDAKNIPELFDKSAKAAKEYKDEIIRLGKALGDLVPPVHKTTEELVNQIDKTEYIMLRFKKAFSDRKNDIVDQGTGIVNDQINAVLQNQISAYDAEINATREFYKTKIALAGDNEKAKDQLRLQEDRKIRDLEKQRANREKEAAKAGIIVNTALGIIKAIATAATIYDGLAEAAIVAAEGASQYVIASNARYYAKGVIKMDGPGTSTSDSIPAFLSKGESVMTAQETNTSEKTLRMIRAKKLNDEVLDRIMTKANSGGSTVGFDDSRLLAATKRVEKAAAGNDIVRKGQLIYEAKKQGDNLKVYTRSKYLS